jgi:hypothetical protein
MEGQKQRWLLLDMLRFGALGYIVMAKSNKVFCVSWVGPHNINKGMHGFMMCIKHYDWVIRLVFLLVLKLQDIDNKSTRVLKPKIPHATSNFMFWGLDGMGPNEALTLQVIQA